MPDTSELEQDLVEVGLPYLWAPHELRDFVEYCYSALQACPDNLRAEVLAKWERTRRDEGTDYRANLLLWQGSVYVVLGNYRAAKSKRERLARQQVTGLSLEMPLTLRAHIIGRWVSPEDRDELESRGWQLQVRAETHDGLTSSPRNKLYIFTEQETPAYATHGRPL